MKLAVSRRFQSRSLLVITVCVVAVLLACERRQAVNPTNPSSPKNWISVSYADLLDAGAIVRTGQTLGSALPDPKMRYAVQPFVDCYSTLLPYVLQMITGPDKVFFHSVVDYFPEGARQPAWVAIFRAGRIHACTDDKKRVRLFLLGDDPKTAYLQNYSIVRHCLRMLLAEAGDELQVDVFAYHNEYQSSELKLNPQPYSFRAKAFESKGGDLDLDALADFFAQGAELRGAALKTDHLVLYGSAGARQVLADQPVELSDLAVAYRAAFHAGENEAFISLDPNKDPTKATVNFGGFLQNTRIGSVVLEADKRFKTITSGLDPNSFQDVRHYTRRYVPAFLTGSERDLLEHTDLTKRGWIGTRFWYYPDAIGVDSDLNYQYAVITNPRFTADAERSKDDFASREEFERRKQQTLPLSIRQNIDDLNRNYTQYASAFPALSELGTVARLMGICSWLRKAEPRGIDLDELLSVELPPSRTESERTQLIAATMLSYGSTDALNPKTITDVATLVFLSPILDKTVGEFFRSEANVAKFLAGNHDSNQVASSQITGAGSDLFRRYHDSKVRDILQTKESVELLAEYAADSAGFPHVQAADELKRQVAEEKSALSQLDITINQIKEQMAMQTSAGGYNQWVQRHNEAVNEYERIRATLNGNIGRYNTLDVQSLYMVEIGGGIDLGPSKFAVRTNPASPKLIEFKSVASVVKPQWTEFNGEKWISSENGNGRPSLENKSGTTAFSQKADQTKRWTTSDAKDGSWKAALKVDTDHFREVSYNAQKQQMQVAEFSSGHLKDLVVAQKEAGNRIVFQKSDRTNILPPQDPPVWYTPN